MCAIPEDRGLRIRTQTEAPTLRTPWVWTLLSVFFGKLQARLGSQDPAQPLPTVSAHLVTSHTSRQGCQWHCRARPQGPRHKDHDSYTLPSLAPGLVLKERSIIPIAWPTRLQASGSQLTQGEKVLVVFQHHVPVQGPLRGIQLAPLFLGEVHSHILKSH